MKRITQENAAKHIGMTLNSSRPRFHYYPLRVFCWTDGYYAADRNGVAYLKKKKKEGGIPYDIETPTEKGEADMNELEKVLQAIEEQQKKLGESPAFWVGEQLKDILRETPAAAQIVLEDFSAGHTVADCEKKIKAYAERNHGCCPPPEAARIIREFFGITDYTQVVAPAEKHTTRRAINLVDFM